MTQGRFISLEGGEGVGKSTQLERLADALHECGIDVLVTREPGGSAGAEEIRPLLLSGEPGRWSPRSEALLFAAARADHVDKTIRPALAKGRWVLTDRFLDSSRAYQGASGLDDEEILALHRFGSGGFLPDRTLVLALPVHLGERRAALRDGGDPDRIGSRDPAYFERVAEAFERIAADEPERVRLVDAAGSPDQVTERLIAELADLLP